jgi:hypothetical protein
VSDAQVEETTPTPVADAPEATPEATTPEAPTPDVGKDEGAES